MALPADSVAQTLWGDQDRPRGVWFEALRPVTNDQLDLSTFSSSWFIGGRYDLSSELDLVGEVPIAFGKLTAPIPDGGTITASDASLGNPYVGVEWQPTGKPFFFEGGAWIPLVSDDLTNAGTAVGLLSEFGNRVEAFFPDILPIAAMFNYQPTVGAFSLRLRAGPTLWIPTADELDTEVLASYSGQVGFEPGRLVLLSGLTGRWAATADGSFGERSTHFWGGSLGVRLGDGGRYVPNFQFRVPLDGSEDTGGLDTVIGVGLSVRLQ